MNDPHGFVQVDWRPYLVTDNGRLERGIWEISLAFAVRDALRAGSLFLAHSRDHVSFWNLVYDDRSWQQTPERQLLPVSPPACRGDARTSHGLSQRSLPMLHTGPVNWQPISEMPLIASMIDGALADTRKHIETLTEARTRPHVLDDATVHGSKRVHAEQLEFVDIYARQISRWRSEKPSATQIRELDRIEEQNRHLRTATADGLALVGELHKGTIERVLAMSDPELGLQALLCSQRSNHL